MSELIHLFKRGSQIFHRSNNDWFDRLSSGVSVALCLAFSFVIYSADLVGDKIICLSPNEAAWTWAGYINRVCWMKNTYTVLFAQRLPGHTSRDDLEIRYYQWIPVILFIQTLLFAAPGIFWQIASSGACCDTNSLIRSCKTASQNGVDMKKEVVKHTAFHMDKAFLFTYLHAKSVTRGLSPWRWFGRDEGNYLLPLYLITKLLYFGAAIGQLVALEWITSSNGSRYYGISVISHYLSKKEMPTSRIFPSVTYCDFEIRKFGQNVHAYTVQCALPWNIIIEKMYVFMWFWLIFVALLSFIGFVSWLPCLSSSMNKRTILKYLNLVRTKENTSFHEYEISRFVDEYLRYDGAFMLYLVIANTERFLTADLVKELYGHYSLLVRNTESETNCIEEDVSSSSASAAFPSQFSLNSVLLDRPADMFRGNDNTSSYRRFVKQNKG